LRKSFGNGYDFGLVNRNARVECGLLLPLVTIDPNKFPSAADKSNKGCQGDWTMRTARVLTPKTFGRALILASQDLNLVSCLFFGASRLEKEQSRE
jgi:hypothetical protein